MQSSMNQDLLEIQKALLGFASNASQIMKDQLELTLKILIEVNAQIQYSNAMRSMLHGKMASADTGARLKAITSALLQQNDVLTKIQKGFPTNLFLNDQALAPTQKAVAEKMFGTLGKQIDSLIENNKNLLDEAKKQREAKLGKVRQDAVVEEESPKISTSRRPGSKQ